MFLEIEIMGNLVYGVGVNDGEYLTTIKGNATQEYALWCGMLERVMSVEYLKKYPSYLGCSISYNFKYYSYFHQWCQRQISFGLAGWVLDKDLLVKGNKVYSEENCVFIPAKINSTLINAKAVRGNLPVGVTLDKRTNRYRAMVSLGDLGRKHLGLFKSAEEAFLAYKQAKEAYILTLAEKYKSYLDPRAYQALKTYQVEITD